MLASDATLPAECREVLHDLIWSIPQNELLTYAATGAALMGGGFRKNNVGVVRARVMQVAEGKEQIDDNLRKLLVRHDQCASCLALLSEETIRDNLGDLAALFGAHRLALALQLDPRLSALWKVESGKWKVVSADTNRQTVKPSNRRVILAARGICPITIRTRRERGGNAARLRVSFRAQGGAKGDIQPQRGGRAA